MPTPDNLVLVYKELADWHERQGRPQMRDRFLVLAADAALSAGRPAEADLFLGRLLRANPHHMLRPFATFGEAMASPDVRTYVGELRQAHPPQQAESEFDAVRALRGRRPPRPTRALPPTAPVLDLDDDAAGGREPLKVYRVQDEGDPPAAPRPAAPRPPLAPPSRPMPRPVRPVPLSPLDEADPVPPTLPPRADAEDAARGSWLSVALFVLLLAAGLTLAGWTLLRPFLPRG